MQHLTLTLIVLAFPWAAGAQECVTPPQTCQVCVLSTGTVGISSCGQSAPQECPSFPSSLLTRAPDVEPGSLQEMLAARIESLWAPGSALYDVMTDERRDFIRRAEHDLLEILRRDFPENCARADLLRDATILYLKIWAVDCTMWLEVRNIPTGDGGSAPRLVASSGASHGRCSGAFTGWLPRQLGTFTEAELRPFVVARAFAMSAKSEAQEELLVGLAAQLRELSPEDRLNVLDHMELMGADLEGGRE